MLIKLKKIGNSQGITIHKAVLELLNITMDTQLQLETDGTNLILKPIRTDSVLETKSDISNEYKATKTLTDGGQITVNVVLPK